MNIAGRITIKQRHLFPYWKTIFFFETRLVLNDSQDNEALAGGVDTENRSVFISFEAQRRIADTCVIELQARFFTHIDEKYTLMPIKRDAFINISFQYHF